MSVRLTPRDKEIFHFIYENGYATSQQIHKIIFSDQTFKAAKIRLLKLLCDEYLKKFKGEWDVFKLTRKALKKITIHEEDRRRYERKKIIKNQMEHDLGITDCKIILKKSYTTSQWVPTHLIGQSYTYLEDERIKMPDAVFDLCMNGKNLKTALEYELTQKTSDRYRFILEKYYVHLPIDLLLYIVNGEALKSTLLDIGKEKIQELAEREITSKNKLYVTTIEEFQKKGLDAEFEGTTGKKFTIKELEHRAKSEPQNPFHAPFQSGKPFGKEKASFEKSIF